MKNNFFVGLLMLSTFAIHAEVKHIVSTADFNAAINKSSLTVVKFGAEWCGPCRSSKPIFERISNEFSGVMFVEVDVDRGSAIANRYDVTGIPLFVYFTNGKELMRHSGGSNSLDLTLKNSIHRFGGASASTEKKRENTKEEVEPAAKEEKTVVAQSQQEQGILDVVCNFFGSLWNKITSLFSSN